jgi:hypothetical protein
MAREEQDLYIFDPAEERFVPNPELTKTDEFGVVDYVGGETVVLSYDQISGYFTDQAGGDSPGELYPPGTFYLVSQNRHISIDGTIRVDVVVEIVDEFPGKQYELRVTRT